LLAAVIISLVVISLGITTNQAKVKKEPHNFRDFTFEIKREAGAVVDFEIYSGFENDANLTDFVRLLAIDIKDRDPNANFFFLYGTNDNMILRNYGEDSVTAGGGGVPGSGIVPGKICFGGPSPSCINVSVEENLGFGTNTTIDPNDANNITIQVFGEKFNFPISKHRKVIFIMQKIAEDENYVFIG
jgi:hypothetical protein